MISTRFLNNLKDFVEIQANLIAEGILYLVIEDGAVVWRKASDSFFLDVLHLGSLLNEDSPFLKAISENRVISQLISRGVYGERVQMTSIPIVNDAGSVVGAFAMLVLRLNPIAVAFDKFAPIMAEMFPEGVMLYFTTRESYTHKQASKLLNLPIFNVGDKIKENDPSDIAIKTKQINIQEFDAEQFGVPVIVASYPLFDQEYQNLVVNTFGIVLSKKTAAELRTMSRNLENSLGGISAAIQQLAASASSIHGNEQILNNDIRDITKHSKEINNISAFIKGIADETNMLGLNAAIEAARVGAEGRGFSVVAEEMRKLSVQSKETVPKIKELTTAIQKSVDKAIDMSNCSLDSSQEQAAASEEISASIEEITNIASQLNQIAKQI